MTLQSKTERLERELRVMGDRLRTLETRNKDLEATNREEWVRHYKLPTTLFSSCYLICTNFVLHVHIKNDIHDMYVYYLLNILNRTVVTQPD